MWGILVPAGLIIFIGLIVFISWIVELYRDKMYFYRHYNRIADKLAIAGVHECKDARKIDEFRSIVLNCPGCSRKADKLDIL